ncbi:hypothetical protein J2S03_003077 [Alicyclobacillus cycloheptanicus]|uniref:Uncharacterized protein n=1 Tax=Alicyclobacillus cycloheptanicus TaxID=1457 RepID=A0ABT9XN99_9BACL|nr:hypothetical protein [Alicyclobacillus cycloheptanicus]
MTALFLIVSVAAVLIVPNLFFRAMTRQLEQRLRQFNEA